MWLSLLRGHLVPPLWNMITFMSSVMLRPAIHTGMVNQLKKYQLLNHNMELSFHLNPHLCREASDQLRAWESSLDLYIKVSYKLYKKQRNSWITESFYLQKLLICTGACSNFFFSFFSNFVKFWYQMKVTHKKRPQHYVL